MNAHVHRRPAFFSAAALSAFALALATPALASTPDGESPVFLAQSTQQPQPSEEQSKREARTKASQDTGQCYEYRWRQVGHPGKGPWKRVRVPVACDRQR